MNKPMNPPHHTTALATALALMLAMPAAAAEPYRQSGEQGGSPMSGAMSQPQGAGQGDRFNKADANQDGVLNRAEFQALQQGGEMPMAGLADKRIKDLKGAEVVNQEGAKIGKVDKILLHRQDNQLHAVVSVGGFLGIGDKEVALPLAEMNWQEDKLHASTTATKDQLKARPAYDRTAYGEVDGNKTVAQWGGGKMEHTTLSFEAVDANKDERIDRSEFSAFESGESMTQPMEHSPATPQGRELPGKGY